MWSARMLVRRQDCGSAPVAAPASVLVSVLAAVLSLVVGYLAVACGPTVAESPDAALGPDSATQADAEAQPDVATVDDRDGDGVPDAQDPCPDDPLQWTDFDGDGHCDEVDDGCPEDPTRWLDTDGDGVCDEDDDCPDDPAGWVDSNNDGQCDAADDTDGDGLSDGDESEYGEDCTMSDPLLADTDGDGVGDMDDPYPRDPFPEYILYRNDLGTIDIMLSNRDGTFQPPVEIGEPFGCTPDTQHNCGNTGYRYISFVIADFDNNGSMDFLAMGDADPSDPTNPYELWYFWRSNQINTGGATLFDQRLVEMSLPRGIFGVAADVDNDHLLDLVTVETDSTHPNGPTYVYSHLNTGLVATADCAYDTDPTNPNGCAFIRTAATDISSFAEGQWAVRYARDAVDVDNDGFRDLVFYTYASGGAAATPTYLLSGNGDGTFGVPPGPMFTFNSAGGCGSSPANSCVFGDFDNDGVGDLIMGFDDDGDAGSAWFIPGQVVGGLYSVNTGACFEALDINPADESGSENPGFSTSAKTFDFDFDGNLDIVVGHTTTSPWDPPTRTSLLMGGGDGLFASPTAVRDFATSGFGNSFAIPKRLCTRFPNN